MLTEYLWFVVAGGVFCFTLGFGMGANDVANNFGPSVGAKSISLKKALCIAAIFELAGSVGLGGTVTDSVRKGVYDHTKFGEMPDFLLLASVATLISSTIWLFMASHLYMSVSTTHALIGSMAGCGLAVANDAVNWSYIGKVAGAWVAAPLAGALVGALFYAFLRQLVLRHSSPLERGKKMLPGIVLYVCFVIVFYFVFSNPMTFQSKACEQLIDGVLVTQSPCIVSKWVKGHRVKAAGIALGAAIGAAILTYFPLRVWTLKTVKKRTQIEADKELAKQLALEEAQLPRNESYVSELTGDEQAGCKVAAQAVWENAPWNKDLHLMVEERNAHVGELAQLDEKFDVGAVQFFTALQTMSASLACLVHGSNDVSNAAAPFASIYSIYEEGAFLTSVKVPIWILFLAGSSISLGLMFLGYKVIQSVGIELVHMTPPKGFAVEMALFTVIIFNSFIGMPVSSTHIGVGAMIGVGLISRHQDPETGDDITKSKMGLNFAAVNWRLTTKLAVSWVGTLIICGVMSYLIFSFAVFSPSKNTRFLGCEGTWQAGICVPYA